MTKLATVIDKVIASEIKDFSEKFFNDYCSKKGKKKSNIENKKNNIFIAALGKDIALNSTLMRSLDSSLGNRIEKIAKLIAEKNFIVKKEVKGYIPVVAVNSIAQLLESYENRERKPKIEDIKQINLGTNAKQKRKKSKKFTDYYLTLKKDKSKKFLIELKIGGDLDNKKAKSEKDSLLRQYVLLKNSKEIKLTDKVKILFCTAYNKNGEGKPWKQERVKQYFSSSELLIGKDFWNFICNSPKGYQIVKSSYLKHSHSLKKAIEKITEHHS